MRIGDLHQQEKILISDMSQKKAWGGQNAPPRLIFLPVKLRY